MHTRQLIRTWKGTTFTSIFHATRLVPAPTKRAFSRQIHFNNPHQRDVTQNIIIDDRSPSTSRAWQPVTDEDDIVTRYYELRDSPPSTEHVRRVRELLMTTPKDNLPGILDVVVLDLLQSMDPDGASSSVEAVTAARNISVTVLELAAQHAALNPDSFVDLFGAVKLRDEDVPLSVLMRFVRHIIADPSTATTTLDEESWITGLTIQLLDRPTSSGSDLEPTRIALAFRVLERHLTSPVEGTNKLALDLFRHLIKIQAIPREVLPEVGSFTEANGEDKTAEHRQLTFRRVVLSAIVRSCVIFNWFDRGRQYLETMFRVCVSPTEERQRNDYRRLNALVEHLVENMMDNALAANGGEQYELLMEASAALRHFCGVQPKPWAYPTLSRLHNQFYKTCSKLDILEPVKLTLVYFAQDVPGIHPLPSGQVLNHMLEYLAKEGQFVLGKWLGERVAGKERLPIQGLTHMAGYIIGLLGVGHLRLACEFYDLALTRTGKELVTGNAGMVSKLVFKLMDAASREESKDADKLGKIMRTMAVKVVDEFKAAKSPITEASHFDITTLARCYVSIREPGLAMETLGHLLERKELPDMYDINLCLQMVSDRDPKRGLQLLRRIIHASRQQSGQAITEVVDQKRRGRHGREGPGLAKIPARLAPNQISFEVVLRSAIHAKDLTIVEEVTALAEEEGYLELSNEALVVVLGRQLRLHTESDTKGRQEMGLYKVLRILRKHPRAARPRLGYPCVKIGLDLGQFQDAIDAMVLCYRSHPDLGRIADMIRTRLQKLPSEERSTFLTRLDVALAKLDVIVPRLLPPPGS